MRARARCARRRAQLPGAHSATALSTSLHPAAATLQAHPLHTHATCKSTLVTSAHWCPMHTINSALFCRSRKYTHEARYARRAQSTARFSSTGSTRAWWTWCSSSPTSARPSKAGDPDSRSPKEPCTRGKHMHHRMLVSTFYTIRTRSRTGLYIDYRRCRGIILSLKERCVACLRGTPAAARPRARCSAALAH